MRIAVLLVCFLSSTIFTFGQDDPRFGTIIVRKPNPIEFFIEVDSTPNYLLGDLQNDIYNNLVTPSRVISKPEILMMEVIIDKSGSIVWVDAPENANGILVREAKRVLSNFIGSFQPHTEQGLLVPAKFVIPIRFNP